MDATIWAWFGGGANLMPYFLFQEDIRYVHSMYTELCDSHLNEDDTRGFCYESMKKACDDYFYLPSRQEHRGTGGIFFDDLVVNDRTLNFVRGVVTSWMPSWIPNIVKERCNTPYTDKQKEWQLLQKGRYLEFNLLYDVSHRKW
jgi:coproporphyrinogen III oxidase